MAINHDAEAFEVREGYSGPCRQCIAQGQMMELGSDIPKETGGARQIVRS